MDPNPEKRPVLKGVDLLRWERELVVGDRVRARWGYGLGFRASGAAKIVRINEKSFRVRLTADVASPHPYGGVGWIIGQELRIPRGISSEWHPEHGVEPLEDATGGGP